MATRKKMRTKHTVREKERPSVAPKRLLRRKKEESAPLPHKPKKRTKKKTRVQHMFKKGQPNGSRPY